MFHSACRHRMASIGGGTYILYFTIERSTCHDASSSCHVPAGDRKTSSLLPTVSTQWHSRSNCTAFFKLKLRRVLTCFRRPFLHCMIVRVISNSSLRYSLNFRALIAAEERTTDGWQERGHLLALTQEKWTC